MVKDMKRLNICIDIDGTMTDPYYFMPYFNKYFNKNLSIKDCTTHRIDELYGLDVDGINIFYEKIGEDMHKNATILPNVKKVFDELSKCHNLHIVTARRKSMEEITEQWLKKHEIAKVSLHSLGSYYKVDKAKELKCDIFIEDNPQNSSELAQAGIKVLLMDTNYNKTLSHKNITRVQNWNDIKLHIDNISKY